MPYLLSAALLFGACVTQLFAQFSVDSNCIDAGGQRTNFFEKPCVVPADVSCNHLAAAVNGTFVLTPYPICLPKGSCAADVQLRNAADKLFTDQRLTLFIHDVNAVNWKRVLARSTLEVGTLGQNASRQFPRCITNHLMQKKTVAQLEYAYGSCELDTASSNAADSLCDLFTSGRIKTRDELGVDNVVQCHQGLIHFRPDSACVRNNRCTVQFDYVIEYVEDGPVVYLPFRGKELTIRVELFQLPANDSDTSYIYNGPTVQRCRQYSGGPLSLGYFYVKFLTRS